jgi:hypothetical protein
MTSSIANCIKRRDFRRVLQVGRLESIAVHGNPAPSGTIAMIAVALLPRPYSASSWAAAALFAGVNLGDASSRWIAWKLVSCAGAV